MDPDGTPAVETAEAPVQAAEEAAPAEEVAETPEVEPEFDAISAIFDKESPAETFKALEGVLEKEGWDSFKVSKDEYEAALENPVVARLLTNARNLGLKRSDEAARAERAAVERQAELDRRALELDEKRSKLWGAFKDPRILGLLDAPAEEAPDFYTNPEEFAKFHSKTGGRETLQQFLAKIDEVFGDSEAELQQAKAAAARATAKTELRTFTEQNEDFFDFGDEIEALVKQGIKAQRAYYMVKGEKIARGEVPAPSNQQQAPPRVDPRASMRASARTVNQQGLPPTPTGMNGHDLQDWYDQHPGTRERDFQLLADRGTSLR